MEFSRFGKRFTRHTGARELMDDLGAANAGGAGVMMLGGGNPAHVPEMLEIFRARLREVSGDDAALRRMLADYSDPAGERGFREAVAALLSREYGWRLDASNVALTSGSQSGFFMLFNLLAGQGEDGMRRILLPLTPEYIGYADLGLEEGLFVARRPSIELIGERQFKYHVDFDALDVGDDIAAICVSRPTNPTGNVITDEEVRRLAAIAGERDIPLILDSAYGLPFPGIVFGDAAPYWDEHTVLCLSLSKLGLPGVRTGIIVARADIIDALTGMNAVTSLAVGNVGPVLMQDLVASGEVLRLGREVIRPHYERGAAHARACLDEALAGIEYRVHRPEGAFFLWLWLPELPVPSAELYRRLKARGVYVLSGHYFFPGLEDDWPHRHQCLRISYTRGEGPVARGIQILGEEVRRLCGDSSLNRN